MPEPARLTGPYMGQPLTVQKGDVHRLQLWINKDGNGEATLPIRRPPAKKPSIGKIKTVVEYVHVLGIPGTALGVMSTLMANDLGFKVYVDNASSHVSGFLHMTLK